MVSSSAPQASEGIQPGSLSVAADVLVGALRRVLGADASESTVTVDSLLDELGIDSIVLAELIGELEATLSCALSFRPVGRLVSVADLGLAVHRIEP